MKVTILEKKDEYFKVKMGNNVINIRCSNMAECTSKSGEMAILAIHMDKMKIFSNEVSNSIQGKSYPYIMQVHKLELRLM